MPTLPKNNYFCETIILTIFQHMITLKEGDKAPHFQGVNQDGNPISLDDFSGKKLILYFYPKDNTSGCTAEACSLNDAYAELTEKGFDVVGVSPDPIASHLKFIAKYNLSFQLIADTEKTILQAYGVWGEKKMYGRSYMGVIRTTFIINEQGYIEKIIDKVKTKEHAQQILQE